MSNRIKRLKHREGVEVNGTVFDKIDRQKLYCPRCPPNKGCNARGRQPKSDKYKNHR